YHAAPNCVYTDPEIAHVGLGEKEAKEKGIEVRIGKFPFVASGRALTLGQAEGFAKVIADASSGRLLGAHIIGPRATDLIPAPTLPTWRPPPPKPTAIPQLPTAPRVFHGGGVGGAGSPHTHHESQ